MKIYKVCSPIRHNGTDYESGDTIGLTDKEAVDLIAVQAINANSLGDAPTNSGVPTDPAKRQDEIVAAISKLDKATADLWLADGRPSTFAIKDALGWTVTADERDAAWVVVSAA
jgi:hypothetical protein